jgi:DNA (cytosine-5)-methyltransferase 1
MTADNAASVKPVMVDAYCGAGGATKGYQDAGFYVIGVDINAQPRYCGDEFYRADALEFLSTFDVPQAVAVHASPPCQAYSVAVLDKTGRPDLLGATRERLEALGLPWVIENVPGAPMRADYVLCGSMFGLPGLRRHRWFETSWHGFALTPPCRHDFAHVSVIGHGPDHHSPFADLRGPGRWQELRRRAMGIDWMTRDELSEAVPPAYTEFIGGQLLALVRL